MTLRTKSRRQQWTVWLCAFIVALAAYVVLTRVLYGSMNWNVLAPLQQRIALPLLFLLYLVATETRWDGAGRQVRGEGEGEGEGEGGARSPGAPQSLDNVISSGIDCGADGVCAPPSCQHNEEEDDRHSTTTTSNHHCSPSPLTFTSSHSSPPGEEFFTRARALPHHKLPSFSRDGEYLNLLGKSALAGYAPAMAKFWKYAMRRSAWIEAYYWMKQAQRSGMRGLTPTLRTIRSAWAHDGFHGKSLEVHEFFTRDSASFGRALINLDSGRDTASAHEYLKVNHPEFL